MVVQCHNGSSNGVRYVLEATSDFRTWITVDSNVASADTVTLIDSGAGAELRRFYRVRRN
jgi:hypothetical protein